MKTAMEFLERMFLPGYMSILREDYSGRKAWFDFRPVEPQVTVLSGAYLTPRGTHIMLSQGTYCLFEKLVTDEGVLDRETLERLGFEGRLKFVEFNQRFGREVKLVDSLQGRLVLTKLRPGKMPVVKFDFDLDNKAVTGDITAVIAPKPMQQTNVDILRIN